MLCKIKALRNDWPKKNCGEKLFLLFLVWLHSGVYSGGATPWRCDKDRNTRGEHILYIFGIVSSSKDTSKKQKGSIKQVNIKAKEVHDTCSFSFSKILVHGTARSVFLQYRHIPCHVVVVRHKGQNLFVACRQTDNSRCQNITCPWYGKFWARLMLYCAMV